MTGEAPKIGTLREKPLHASLKRWYSRHGDSVEVPVDEFVVDLVRDGQLIEVQTRSFSALKKKLTVLLDRGHRVRIVHPIAVDRWIVKVANDGTILSRRLSPKHGSPLDLFTELVSFPDLLARPGLDIDVISTQQEEYRTHIPGRSWRRKGWTVAERRLLSVIETQVIGDADDLVRLLPVDLGGSFTTADIAVGSGCSRRTAQQAAYCLRVGGAIVPVGKQGNAVEYRLASP